MLFDKVAKKASRYMFMNPSARHNIRKQSACGANSSQDNDLLLDDMLEVTNLQG